MSFSRDKTDEPGPTRKFTPTAPSGLPAPRLADRAKLATAGSRARCAAAESRAMTLESKGRTAMAATGVRTTGTLLRRLVGYPSVALAAAALSLSPGASRAATPVKGGTLVLTLGADAPTVTPDVSTGIPAQLIGCLLYQG